MGVVERGVERVEVGGGEGRYRVGDSNEESGVSGEIEIKRKKSRKRESGNV